MKMFNWKVLIWDTEKEQWYAHTGIMIAKSIEAAVEMLREKYTFGNRAGGLIAFNPIRIITNSHREFHVISSMVVDKEFGDSYTFTLGEAQEKTGNCAMIIGKKVVMIME